jgi:5-methylcytosine-specific restriction endonuclease McrA
MCGMASCACGCGKEATAGRWYYKGHRPPDVAASRRRAGAAKRQAAYRARKGADAVREEKRAYYAANAERERERQRAFQAALGADERSRRNRIHNAKRDPVKVLENARVQKARRRGMPFTTEGRAYAVVLAADPCSYCGRVAGHIDHIVPLKFGGDGDWMNLTASCQSCNSRKGTRPLLAVL